MNRDQKHGLYFVFILGLLAAAIAYLITVFLPTGGPTP